MDYRPRAAGAATALTATSATTIVRGKRVRWNLQMKAEFLDHLAASCNVTASAAAIGVGPLSLYGLRRRDPEFAREWQGALESGYQLLETMLLGHVLSGGTRTDAIETAHDAPKLDVETALRLLTAHRGSVGKPSSKIGRPLERAELADTAAAILKKLSAIEKRRGGA